MSYKTEYDMLSKDAQRIEKFKATGKEGKRIFTVLNSNIKSLQTLGEYINTMFSQSIYDPTYKQMNERVRAFNFRSLENKTERRATIRSNIVRKAGSKFGGFDHAFVALLLYLLLLDSGVKNLETVDNAKKFITSLPIFIKRRLFNYARQIALSDGGAFPNENVYLEMVVLYGDERLYSEFIQHIYSYYPDENAITNLFVQETKVETSPISLRIKSFQSSALKKDALYTIIFYALDQYVRKCKMKNLRTGKKTMDAEKFMFGFLDYFNAAFDGALKWLGKINNGEEMETIKKFIALDLSSDEKEEIYTCLRNAFGLQVPEK